MYFTATDLLYVAAIGLVAGAAIGIFFLSFYEWLTEKSAEKAS